MEPRIQNSESRRTPAKSFEELIVWQQAHAWVLTVCRLSDSFPPKENHALTSQFRRAAMSVPASIAEGFKKRGVRDKLRYFNLAQGSLEERRYYLTLAIWDTATRRSWHRNSRRSAVCSRRIITQF